MNDFQEMEPVSRPKTPIKFIIGGLAIVAGIIYLMVSSLNASAQYFLTVDEILSKSRAGELEGRNVRVSGAVLGESIDYDIDTLELSFTIAHVPGENQLVAEEGGLAEALHNAVSDEDRSRLDVVYSGPIPDLLQNEAQAILTGQMLPSGEFLADEILLKCPTKYEGEVPEQISLEQE
jgi:cytochrome c-type biogenesis protein CcmE